MFTVLQNNLIQPYIVKLKYINSNPLPLLNHFECAWTGILIHVYSMWVHTCLIYVIKLPHFVRQMFFSGGCLSVVIEFVASAIELYLLSCLQRVARTYGNNIIISNTILLYLQQCLFVFKIIFAVLARFVALLCQYFTFNRITCCSIQSIEIVFYDLYQAQ